jgi:hypothetical protein
MDIIITLPSNITWKDYERELNDVKNGKSVLNFKVNNFPKLSKVGDKCYLNYKGNIIGWMYITGLSEKEFTCSITGKKWDGKFIERSGPFYSIDPIPMKGFRGFRYFNLSESFISKFDDYIIESLRDKMKPKEGSKEKLNKLNDKLISMMIKDNFFDTYEEAFEFLNDDDILDNVSHMAGLGLELDEIYIEVTQFYLDDYLYNKGLPLKFAFREDIKDNPSIIGSDAYNRDTKTYYYEDERKKKERDMIKKKLLKESIKDKMIAKSDEEINNLLSDLSQDELDSKLLSALNKKQYDTIELLIKNGADAKKAYTWAHHQEDYNSMGKIRKYIND